VIDPDDPDLQEAWLDLRRHLEWAQGFALLFLFGPENLSTGLREQLRASLTARTCSLQVIAEPGTTTPPADLAQTLTAAVLDAAHDSSDLQRRMGVPLWVELQGPNDPDGVREAARAGLLERLNENRDRLRRELRRPLVVVLPSTWRRPSADLAPDLWSIRNAIGDSPQVLRDLSLSLLRVGGLALDSSEHGA